MLGASAEQADRSAIEPPAGAAVMNLQVGGAGWVGGGEGGGVVGGGAGAAGGGGWAEEAGNDETHGRRAVVCIFEGVSTTPVSSCTVSSGNVFTLDSAEAGPLLSLFELLHSVVVEPARLHERERLKHEPAVALNTDEFVIGEAAEATRATLLKSLIGGLSTGSRKVVMNSDGLPSEADRVRILSVVLASENMLRALRPRFRPGFIRSLSVKMASMNIKQIVLDLQNTTLGLMSGRESREMLKARGARAGVDGAEEVKRRATRFCLILQLHDNMTMRLVLRLMLSGKLKVNITMLGHLVFSTAQLVADKIYGLPDNPVPPASVVYDYELSDQQVLLLRFIERNTMLSLLLPYVSQNWAELDSMPVPVTLNRSHIGKTRRMARLPGSADPSYFRDELVTGWSEVDPSTRSGVNKMAAMAETLRCAALDTPEPEYTVLPAEEPIMHSAARTIVATDGAGAHMLHTGIDEEPKTTQK